MFLLHPVDVVDVSFLFLFYKLFARICCCCCWSNNSFFCRDDDNILFIVVVADDDADAGAGADPDSILFGGGFVIDAVAI